MAKVGKVIKNEQRVIQEELEILNRRYLQNPSVHITRDFSYLF